MKKIDDLAKKTAQSFEKITAEIGDLAMMTARGFEKTATKLELEEVKTDLIEIKVRLDRIENLLIRDIGNRVEKLEDRVRVIETATGTNKIL